MTGHVGCAFRPGAASSGKYCTVQRCLATSLRFGVARQSRRNAHTNADVNRARRHSQSGATRATGGQASAAKAATTDFKVVIAGAGIGGLVLAVALLKKGVDVLLIERDLTAIRGEGKYRGPIQIQSNALAALEAIDAKMGAEVLSAGCVTGDRVNGLCDGVSGDWYVKFDTFHPAADKGLPVTRVVNRYTLQNILMKRAIELAGEGVIRNGCTVVGYEERKDSQGRLQVEALLDNGERVTGSMLVGADGIRSKVREQMVGKQEAHYSEYTCYTGISNFTPHDIDTVGYRVFLGNGQYFVSSDVGDGKMQWYGFHEEPAGGGDAPGKSKERLMEIFGDWCDDVVDLIQCTPEEDVLRRDIYDRPPIFTWTRGSVVLLGDSAHAMQPNLGQGGCMAIEDGYELSKLLADGLAVTGPGQSLNVKPILQQYQTRRLVRASAIHGMAGMAAIAASTYKAYLGEGLGPLSWIQQFQIPHPGRVAGQLVLKSSMPFVLDWVLGGNVGNLRQEDRAAYCSLSDAPRAFSESMFPAFMRDDDQLLLAMRADWLLLPLRRHQTARLLATDSVENCTYLSESNQATSSLTVGAGASCALRIQDAAVDSEHARLEKRSDGFHYAIDLGSSSGTWLNDKRLQPHVPTRLHPADTLAFGASPDNAALRYKIKLRHETLRNAKSLFVSDHPDESFVGEAVGV